MPHVARAIHGSSQGMTEFLTQTLAITEVTRGVEPGRTPSTRLGRKVRMLLSFQRPSRPVGKGSPSKGRSPEPKLLERAEKFSTTRRRVSDPVRPDVRAPLSGSIRTDRSRASPGRRADAPARVRSRPDPLCRKAIRAAAPGATAKRSSPAPWIVPCGPDAEVNVRSRSLVRTCRLRAGPMTARDRPRLEPRGGGGRPRATPPTSRRPGAGSGACPPAGRGRRADRRAGRRRRTARRRRRA